MKPRILTYLITAILLQSCGNTVLKEETKQIVADDPGQSSNGRDLFSTIKGLPIDSFMEADAATLVQTWYPSANAHAEFLGNEGLAFFEKGELSSYKIDPKDKTANWVKCGTWSLENNKLNIILNEKKKTYLVAMVGSNGDLLLVEEETKKTERYNTIVGC